MSCTEHPPDSPTPHSSPLGDLAVQFDDHSFLTGPLASDISTFRRFIKIANRKSPIADFTPPSDHPGCYSAGTRYAMNVNNPSHDRRRPPHFVPSMEPGLSSGSISTRTHPKKAQKKLNETNPKSPLTLPKTLFLTRNKAKSNPNEPTAHPWCRRPVTPAKDGVQGDEWVLPARADVECPVPCHPGARWTGPTSVLHVQRLPDALTCDRCGIQVFAS